MTPKRLPRPTFASVATTICLFLILGGGAAVAATRLPKDSVGKEQIKKGAVTPAKLSTKAKAGLLGPGGAQGPAGPQGPTGSEGPAGATGLAGGPGEKGATGETGAKGEPGPRGATGASGPVGAAGAKGEGGPTGPTGERGEKGERGETGERGEKGERGETGERGEKGETGPAGPVAVYSAEQNATMTFVPGAGKKTVAELTFPAGSYVIQAAQTVSAGEQLSGHLICEIDVEGVDREDFAVNLEAKRTTTMSGLATAPAGSTAAAVVCEATSSGNEVILAPNSARLVATKVDSIG
jgi:hypothetical protein